MRKIYAMAVWNHYSDENRNRVELFPKNGILIFMM